MTDSLDDSVSKQRISGFQGLVGGDGALGAEEEGWRHIAAIIQRGPIPETLC